MQPWEIIDRARAPDGTELVLARRHGEWVVRAGGRVLMSSRAHGSEEALAVLALERVEDPRAVLVGGLGLGFTLRAVLDRVPLSARVVLAELVPELVGWNESAVAHLAGSPLADARVRIHVGDVADLIAGSRSAFDAILLDVDNGPSSLVHAANERLYGAQGLRGSRHALRPGGVLAIWSAGRDPGFLAKLGRAGFIPEEHAVRARGVAGGVRHAAYVGVNVNRSVTSRPGR